MKWTTIIACGMTISLGGGAYAVAAATTETKSASTNYYEAEVRPMSLGNFADLDWLRERARVQGFSSLTNVAGGGSNKVRIKDDLEWLLGRWKCTFREPRIAGGVIDDFLYLDYFNVYLPYADRELTLDLTYNPADRPIAAEFVVRIPEHGPLFRERLDALKGANGGVVCIGVDKIWICNTVSYTEMSYRVNTNTLPGELILDTGYTRCVLRYVPGSVPDPKQLRHSLVKAPVKDYTDEELLELPERYKKLKESEPKK